MIPKVVAQSGLGQKSVFHNYTFVYVPKLLLHDANTKAEGISKIPLSLHIGRSFA